MRDLPEPMCDLSVVIVSYNTRDLLLACLVSVFQETPNLNLEVIVVDNASEDGSAQSVRDGFGGRTQVIESAQNLGFAAANNLGFAACHGRYVLLLNSDTRVLEGALERLVAFLDDPAHAHICVVGAQLLNPDLTLQDSAFRFPTLAMIFLDFFPLHYRLLRSRLNGRYPVTNEPFSIDHPLGACLLARREALKQVGGLDERFFMYCEEVDWCYRVKQTGWDIYCDPTARVVHYGGQSTKQARNAMYIQLQQSRARFYHKHHRLSWQLTARALTRLGLLTEIGRVLVRYPLLRQEKGDWRSQVDVYWRAMRVT